MSTETKICPACQQVIPETATTCPNCQTPLRDTWRGYCPRCHSLIETDTGRCATCGGELTDRHHIKSEARPASAAARRPAAARPAKKSRTGVIIVIVLGLVLCIGLAVVLGIVIANNSGLSDFTPAGGVPLAQEEDEEEDKAPPLPEPSSGTVEVWYSASTGSTEEQALQGAFAAAEQQAGGLTIIGTSISPGEDGIIQYQTAVAAGSGPDLVLFTGGYAQTLAESGAVLALEDLIDLDALGVSDTALATGRVDGVQYALPLSVESVALYYNNTMLEAPPETTEDLFALVWDGYGLSAPDPAYFLFGFWTSFGGDLLDADGRCIADQGGFVNAWAYMQEMQNAGARLGEDYIDAGNMFEAGEVAMTINGPWALDSYRSSLGDAVSVAPLPAGPGGAARPWVNGLGVYVNPDSRNLENALWMAQFLAGPEVAELIAATGYLVPVRTDIVIADPLIAAFQEAALAGIPLMNSTLMEAYWAPFGEMSQAVLFSGEAPQVALQEACRMMNATNGK